MCTSGFVISLLFVGTVFGFDENQAKLRFYYNSMENYTELYIDEAEKIMSTSWYNPYRKTVMFCHGFTGHPKGPAITSVITTYLSLGSYNVVLLNWDKLAAIALPGLIQSYTNWAMPNALQLGADFSGTLLRLLAAGLNLNNTHFVGHSLGAHVFGIAGNKMLEKGKQLTWITGLDPAIGIDMKPAFLRLNPTSARFVSVIHTDPNRFGSRNQLGVVDFWPNYNPRTTLQPGCPKNAAKFSEEDFCSHNLSWQYFVDALTNPGTMLGSHARNFRMWKKYNDAQKRATVLEVGAFTDNAISGNYYFTTNAKAPYGLGEKGL